MGCNARQELWLWVDFEITKVYHLIRNTICDGLKKGINPETALHETLYVKEVKNLLRHSKRPVGLKRWNQRDRIEELAAFTDSEEDVVEEDDD
jgi:hypothetical protein